MCMCKILCVYGEREREVSLKKTNYVFPPYPAVYPRTISFYFLQPYSWPGNAGHLCASVAGLGHLFDGCCCLHGAIHTQYNCGAYADEPHPASGELVLAGELGPPVNVPGISTCNHLSLFTGAFYLRISGLPFDVLAVVRIWALEKCCFFKLPNNPGRSVDRAGGEEVGCVHLHHTPEYPLCKNSGLVISVGSSS